MLWRLVTPVSVPMTPLPLGATDSQGRQSWPNTVDEDGNTVCVPNLGPGVFNSPHGLATDARSAAFGWPVRHFALQDWSPDLAPPTPDFEKAAATAVGQMEPAQNRCTSPRCSVSPGIQAASTSFTRRTALEASSA